MSEELNQPSNPPEGGDQGGGEDLDARISKIANAAQSSHATRMSKQFDKKLSELTETFSAQLSSLQEALTASAPKEAKPEELEQVSTKYEKKLEQLARQLEEEKAARDQEKQLRARNEERGALTDALRAGGVDGPLLKSAVALLYTEESKVGRDDDGNIIFRTQKDGFDEDVSVADGIAAWLQSDEGKHYAPAKPVAGSGNLGGKHGNQKGPRTKTDAMRELTDILMNGDLT